MFRRNLFHVWFGILTLSCMFLMGQKSWAPPCDNPTCRAQELREQGYSDLEIGELLIQEFNLGASDLAIVLKDVLEYSTPLDAGLLLKSLDFPEYAIQSALIEVYEVYAAIVDIRSNTGMPPPVPEDGFTGVVFCSPDARSTEPYIPGLFGKLAGPGDINVGIGGDFRWVWVKYDLVPVTSDRNVVTGIRAEYWPSWVGTCPEGWTIISALTTYTDCGSGNKIGMCARYEPFKDAEKFVTNVGISYGDTYNPASKCSAVGLSNANIWPLYTNYKDIHYDCGDEHWVYFCYDQAQKWPPRPTTIEVSDNEKLALLEQYAPQVFFTGNEDYFPSSVEWSFRHVFRYSPNTVPAYYYEVPWIFDYHLFLPPDSNYYLSPYGAMEYGSKVLTYFAGCNGSATEEPCLLSDAPAYAFWHKQTIPLGGQEMEVADLTYFFYYPYNRGKEVGGGVWESHVGDWEKTTVRLSLVYNPSIGWEIKPIHLFVSAHSFGTSHPWDTISIVADTDHPKVYSANGGHGNYVTAGTQRYSMQSILGYHYFLYDYTDEVFNWDTWTNLETFDYDAENGLGSSTWPRWMSRDYTASCAPDNPGCDPYDPSSGPIYRWGTDEFDCLLGQVCHLTAGPTGPIEKGIWDDPYEP
jgi:hypothetical protein